MLKNIYFFAASSQAASKQIIPRSIAERELCIEVITKGTVFFTENGIRQAYGNGTVFWHTSGEETVHETDWDNPYECLSIWFDSSAGFSRPFNRVSAIRSSADTKQFATEVLQAFHDNRYEQVHLGNYIYNYLTWECHKTMVSGPSRKAPRQFDKLITVLNNTPERKLDLKQMASLADVSVQHMYRLFNDLLNTTPHQYQLHRRIQKAKNLLSVTDRPMKDICTSCGFDNIETFYRAFRKSEQLTPGDYRKQFTIQ